MPTPSAPSGEGCMWQGLRRLRGLIAGVLPGQDVVNLTAALLRDEGCCITLGTEGVNSRQLVPAYYALELGLV